VITMLVISQPLWLLGVDVDVDVNLVSNIIELSLLAGIQLTKITAT
jgi:hypothetical protein